MTPPDLQLTKKEEDQINYMTKIIILRGLVDPNYDFWKESDKLSDKSGIKIFKNTEFEQVIKEHQISEIIKFGLPSFYE